MKTKEWDILCYIYGQNRHVTKFKNLGSWYAQLTELEQRKLEQDVAEFPQCAKLLSYLQQGLEWNMLRAARFIYGPEADTLPAAQVKRRVFNLAARIRQLPMNYQSAGVQTRGACCIEEEELLYYKSLVLKGRDEELYKGLASLLKRCLEKNIFELLPDVLYYLSYSYKIGKTNRLVLIERDEHLLDLYSAFIKQRGLYTKARHLRRSGGLKYADLGVYLKKIKAIADAYPEYPRLRMIYCFSCLSLGSGPGGNKATASQRYYQALERMHIAHPDFPIMGYRLHYDIHTQYNLLKFKAYIDYRLLHFNTAYLSLKKAWDIQEHYKGSFKPGSISDYQELIVASRFSGRYQEALALTHDFIDSQRRREHELGVWIASSEQVSNYLYNYPHLQVDEQELKRLMSILDKLYQFYKDKEKLRSAGYYRNMKALFYFIVGNYAAAKSCYEEEESRLYNQFYQLQEVGDSFFNLPFNATKGMPAIEQLIKQAWYKRNLKPETLTYFKMMERLLHGLQENQLF